MIEAAPELAVLLVALGGLIFCYLAIYCARAFAGVAHSTIGRLPIVGGWIDAGIHTVTQKIVNIFAEAANSCQSAMGWSFHLMARQVDWLGREINRHANLLALLASIALGPAVATALRAAIAALHGNVHTVTQQITGTYARVLRLEHRLQHTITAGVLPRIGRLEREYDHLIDKDIAGLRSRAKTIEGDLSKLWDYVRTHPWTVVTDAFVGAVAVALTRLGLDWIKCESGKGLFKRRGCGLWGDLENLLGWAFDLLVITNICSVIPLLEKAFSTVAAPLIGTLAAAGAGLCKQGSSPPETLPPPGLSLPASPSLSLYLP